MSTEFMHKMHKNSNEQTRKINLTFHLLYDKISKNLAGVAELADAPDLGSGGFPCRFKSCHPHQKKTQDWIQF